MDAPKASPTEKDWKVLDDKIRQDMEPGESGKSYLEHVRASASAPPALPAPSGSVDHVVEQTHTEKPADPPHPPPPSPPGGGGGGAGESGEGTHREASGNKKLFLAFAACLLFAAVNFVISYYDREAIERIEEKEIKREERKAQLPKQTIVSEIPAPSSQESTCRITKEMRSSIRFPDGCNSITIDADPENPKIYLKMDRKQSFRGSFAVLTLKKDEVRENAVRPILYCQTRSRDEAAYSSSNCESELSRLQYPITVWIAFTDTPLTISR